MWNPLSNERCRLAMSAGQYVAMSHIESRRIIRLWIVLIGVKNFNMIQTKNRLSHGISCVIFFHSIKKMEILQLFFLKNCQRLSMAVALSVSCICFLFNLNALSSKWHPNKSRHRKKAKQMRVNGFCCLQSFVECIDVLSRNVSIVPVKRRNKQIFCYFIDGIRFEQKPGSIWFSGQMLDTNAPHKITIERVKIEQNHCHWVRYREVSHLNSVVTTIQQIALMPYRFEFWYSWCLNEFFFFSLLFYNTVRIHCDTFFEFGSFFFSLYFSWPETKLLKRYLIAKIPSCLRRKKSIALWRISNRMTHQ